MYLGLRGSHMRRWFKKNSNVWKFQHGEEHAREWSLQWTTKSRLFHIFDNYKESCYFCCCVWEASLERIKAKKRIIYPVILVEPVPWLHCDKKDILKEAPLDFSVLFSCETCTQISVASVDVGGVHSYIRPERLCQLCRTRTRHCTYEMDSTLTDLVLKDNWCLRDTLQRQKTQKDQRDMEWMKHRGKEMVWQYLLQWLCARFTW